MRPRQRSGHRWIALPVLLALAAAQDAREAPDFSDEGAIRNSTFLPASNAAQAEIARGDRAHAEALEAGGSRTEAFDAWQNALQISVAGDAVLLADRDELGLWDDPDNTHERRSEGVAYAIRRRLGLLSPAAQDAWTARFEPVAESALARAGSDPERIARVERDHPRTTGAARAALLLADLALERGALQESRAWLDRAFFQARTSAAGEELVAAVKARGETLTALAPKPAGNDPWRTALELEAIGAIRLEESVRSRGSSTSTLGLELDPGLAFLADGSVVVQTPGRLVRIKPTGELARFSLGEVIAPDYPGRPSLRPFASPSSGGWWLAPAAAGKEVLLVIGRARPYRQGVGNILACVGFDADDLPVPRWSLSEEGRKVGDDEYVPHVDDLGSGRWSFQPGPVVFGDTVFVQARQLPLDEEDAGGPSDRIFLCAFDRADGSLRWKRFLTKAADLKDDFGGRFGPTSPVTSPGQPLAVHGGLVFVGTNVGLGALFDAVDGRLLWSFRSRRREASAAGWPGSRPALFASSESGANAVHWAPFDSDFLYTLRAGADDRGQGLYLAPPRPIGEAEILLAAEPGGEALFLGRAGPRATLTARDADWRRRDSLYLARGERFAGFGLVSAVRVLAASDRGLYLFDRERDLYLAAVLPLSDLGGGRGGSVYARGGRVYVLGRDSLWTFQVAR